MRARMSPGSHVLSRPYVPASRPLASGSRAITPMLAAWATAKKRSSASRRTMLYTIWTVSGRVDGRKPLFGRVYGDAVEPDLPVSLQILEHQVGVRVGDQAERGIVELQQVDVVGGEAPQRLLYREPDIVGREIGVVGQRQRNIGCELGDRPARRLGDAAQQQRVHGPVVEIAADLGRDEHVLADPRERPAQEFLRMTVPIHVRRIEEVATQLVGALDGAQRLGVVGGTVRVAESVAADAPTAEANGADREAGAAQHPTSHRNKSPSASRVVTGSEQAVPTHTVALGRSAVLRTTSLRGR